jgi:hypothetical protein
MVIAIPFRTEENKIIKQQQQQQQHGTPVLKIHNKNAGKRREDIVQWTTPTGDPIWN